jgi:hypothetical protein
MATGFGREMPMSAGKLFLWGTVALAVWGLVSMREDIQRYWKISMM